MSIAGVLLTPLRAIEAPAGAVLHAMKASSDGFAGFGEAYFSEIHEGAVKNWRRHRTQTLNLVVPVGAVRFVLHEGRDGHVAAAEPFMQYRLGRLAPASYARLTVPPGIWLAFQGIGPGASLILDITDAEHDPAEAESRDLAAFPFSW